MSLALLFIWLNYKFFERYNALKRSGREVLTFIIIDVFVTETEMTPLREKKELRRDES